MVTTANPVLRVGEKRIWFLPGLLKRGKNTVFIQTETTPNPATLKFLPGRAVADGPNWDFRTIDEAQGVSPLAERILHIPDIEGVFFGADFIAVSRSEGDWDEVRPAVLGAIMEHFLSGDPVVLMADRQGDVVRDDYSEEEKIVVAKIEELLETRVRPAVASDGGDIRFYLFRDGVVWLKMQGACEGCPSSTVTLKHGIENLLRYFVPEVTEVRPV